MNDPVEVTPPALVTPKQAPLLTGLADACNNGACNMGGLIRSLTGAIEELPFGQAPKHPAIKCIMGQLSFLCGESAGPSSKAWDEYQIWRQQR